MLSSADLQGMGAFILFHAMIFLIIGVSLFTGIVKHKFRIGKVLMLISAILILFFLMIFQFAWNPPWNFWAR